MKNKSGFTLIEVLVSIGINALLFGNWSTILFINLKLNGNYAVYFKINDQVYNTNKILSFN